MSPSDIDAAVGEAAAYSGPSHPAFLQAVGTDNEKRYDLLFAAAGFNLAYCYKRQPSAILAVANDRLSRLLKVISFGQHHTLLEAPGKRIVVAFPGTHDLRTVVIDAKAHRRRVVPAKGPTTPDPEKASYKIHAGFHHEAYEVVAATLTTATLADYVQKKGYRIVCCGHSLGGALSALTTLRLLEEAPTVFTPDTIRSVAFGAPLVGGSCLSHRVDSQKWSRCFSFLVHECDIVPCLYAMALGHLDSLARDMRTKLKDSVEMVASFVTSGPASPASPSEQKESTFAKVEEEDKFDEPDASDDSDFDEKATACAFKRKKVFDAFGEYIFVNTSDPKTQKHRRKGDAKSQAILSRVKSANFVVLTPEERRSSFHLLRHSVGEWPSFEDHLTPHYAFLLRDTQLLRHPPPKA